MCGIVGYVGNKKAVPILINGLLSLEYRGYDSAGIAVISDSEKNEKTKSILRKPYEDESKIFTDSELIKFTHSPKIEIVKTKGRVEKLEEKLKNKELESTIGIAHTRWATHGEPSDVNAHPHTDNANVFAVVHNGIIENYDELKNMLMEKGYKFKSETDTEVIPNLLSYYYAEELKSELDENLENKAKKLQEKIKNADEKEREEILKNEEVEALSIDNLKKIYLKAIAKTAKTLKGSFAVEIISSIFKDEIIAIKKDSPLVVGVKNNEKFIASDVPAVVKYTNEFYFMEDYEIAEISRDSLNFYNFDLEKLDKKAKKVDMDKNAASKNGYEDFMLKEIKEQPKAIERTIKEVLVQNKEKYEVNLNLEGIDFSKFNKIYIVACGTAMHSGLATKYIFEHFSKIETEVDMASEFRYRDPLIDKNTLCIFISQSGETADTIAALNLAKEKNCKTIAIVNVEESSITRIADFVIYTRAGIENAVASTKAYTSQVAILALLAIKIYEDVKEKNERKDERKVLDEEEQNILQNISELPKKIKETLKCEEQVKKLAHKYHKEKDIYFIGRGVDFAVSKEGSLKLKEISYIHSEAQASGELKHGPIALIEKGTPVVGIATNERTNGKTFSNIEEVITRGADTILITNTEEKLPEVIEKNEVIKIPKINLMISPILSIIPMQLFAYYIAKEKKLDVDKPRNLAKSVTVE